MPSMLGAGAGHEADTQEARGGVQSEGCAGSNQGRPDGGRAGERVWGSSEPDLRVEEAVAGGGCGRFRRQGRSSGGYGQRGAGRSSVPADWPAEGRKRFFGTKARQMSRVDRRALVEREASALPISGQCRLLAISRSSVYRRPAEISEEDCTIMALIDR